jgi:hypothetical protein
MKRSLVRGAIAMIISEVIFFGGAAALFLWLGGLFVVFAALFALIGAFLVWRAVVQFVLLLQDRWGSAQDSTASPAYPYPDRSDFTPHQEDDAVEPARDPGDPAAPPSTSTTPTEIPGGAIEADRIVMQDLNKALEASIAEDKAREAAKADSTPTTPTPMPGGLIEADRIVMQDLAAGIREVTAEREARETAEADSRPSDSNEPSTPTETPKAKKPSNEPSTPAEDQRAAILAADDPTPTMTDQLSIEAEFGVGAPLKPEPNVPRSSGHDVTSGYTSAHHPECDKIHQNFSVPCNRELSPDVIEYKRHKYTSAHHPECNEIHQNFAAPCNRELSPELIEYKRQRQGEPPADWPPTAPAVGPYGVEYRKRFTFTDAGDVERWIATGAPTGRTRETTTRDELDKLEAIMPPTENPPDQPRDSSNAEDTAPKTSPPTTTEPDQDEVMLDEGRKAFARMRARREQREREAHDPSESPTETPEK